MDISPPENEVQDDDFLFEMDDDSEGENEFLEDTISITSTPKPSLRWGDSIQYLLLRINIFHF